MRGGRCSCRDRAVYAHADVLVFSLRLLAGVVGVVVAVAAGGLWIGGELLATSVFPGWCSMFMLLNLPPHLGTFSRRATRSVMYSSTA